jgi:hypothetical protein
MMLSLADNGAGLISNDREQYRRAVLSAEANSQYAARTLAEELLEKALARHELSSNGIGETRWAGSEMVVFLLLSHFFLLSSSVITTR